MAKKRKSTKKSTPTKPQHSLPVGFWSQVGAVLLILLTQALLADIIRAFIKNLRDQPYHMQKQTSQL